MKSTKVQTVNIYTPHGYTKYFQNLTLFFPFPMTRIADMSLAFKTNGV